MAAETALRETTSDNLLKGDEDVIQEAQAVKNGAEINSFPYETKKTVSIGGVTVEYSKGHQVEGNTTTTKTAFHLYATPNFSEQQNQDLDLRTLYSLPDSHNFYCPNCKSCITKVLILRDDSDGGQALGQIPAETTPEEGRGNIFCGNCFSFLAPIGAWMSSLFGFGGENPSIQPEIRDGDSVVVPILPGEETVDQQQSTGRKLEIIKSIVYGGLTESITSLGIVTSAASANIPTLNIVALALANLITGLIVVVNNLSGLKSSEIKTETNEGSETVQKDQYEEALGDRQHYILHFSLVILSFIVSGLLPPLVYGFSFQDTNNKDMKLVAVAAASLIFVALLAIGKAYIQKSKKWLDYVKTMSYYVTIGVGASGLSYVAGREIDKLLQQLGWFKANPSTPTLSLPDLDVTSTTAWESF